MFQAVIERQGLRAGRLGVGVWVSLGVHAALLAAVVFISSQPVEAPKEEKEPVIVFRPPGPNLAKGSPAPAAPRPAATQPPRPRNRDRVPRQVQPLPPEPPTPPEPEAASASTSLDTGESTGEGVAGGHPDGDPNSTAIGVPLIPGLTGGGATGEEVLPFGAGMTPPEMVGGEPIQYTPQAKMARVEGTLIAKCTITREGRVKDCRIIKGLAHMDEEVLSALETRRYRPMTYQGRPVNVSYIFNVRMKLPR